MERLAAVLCVLIISLAIISAGGAEMMNPEQMPETEGLPELLRFADGREVKTPEDWERRREELLTLYSEYMYGYMPDRTRETVTWTAEAAPELDGTLLTVTVEAEGRSASFSVLAGIPAGEKPAGGFPFYMEYWPWHYQNWFTKEWVSGFSDNCRYAISRGYAGIQYDCGQVAQDNQTFTGAFYTLYPYNRTNPAEQRGTLLAWAWGVSKVIDALESGAGEALGIDPGCALVSGVSRYGKSAAVAGAYDNRIRVTIPSCSGAGGIAVYRTDNHGKTYDLTGLGGPAEWTNDSVNEPFSNLQGGEGYWFCGNFRRFASVKQLPVDQHMLCALEQHGRPVPGMGCLAAGVGSPGNRRPKQYDHSPGRTRSPAVGHGNDPGLLRRSSPGYFPGCDPQRPQPDEGKSVHGRQPGPAGPVLCPVPCGMTGAGGGKVWRKSPGNCLRSRYRPAACAGCTRESSTRFLDRETGIPR